MSMTYYGPRGRSQGTILKIQENTMVPRLRPLGSLKELANAVMKQCGIDHHF